MRGVAGRRSEYRPLESLLCQGSSPREIAHALRDKLGLASLYVADLDAILHARPNWDIYRELVAEGFQLSVDAGLRDASEAAVLADFFETLPHAAAGQGSLIAGLESLSAPAELREMLASLGPARLIFSLDLREGQPLTASTAWPGEQPKEILRLALDLGVERFILLDLARVGVGTGVGTEPLCRHLRSMAPDVELIAGGGVRGVDDLRALAASGCDAALVASALHDGRLDRAAIAEFSATDG